MKSLIILAALAFNVSVNLPYNINCSSIEEISVSEDDVIDFIVMDDDIMLVTTDAINGNIDKIKVFDSYGSLMIQNSGCNASECSTDLSSLSFARYSVSVVTATGYFFTGVIELK